ncbi:hypothetical protein ABH931_002092 [Streptacidiphilus sp. MAP12-33]|uniref:hypothetical protein n=1 Tax=Streptacidiphilus sp. MAP12-33 TaxID=3156266 RepID=UPI0035124D57
MTVNPTPAPSTGGAPVECKHHGWTCAHAPGQMPAECHHPGWTCATAPAGCHHPGWCTPEPHGPDEPDD